jgi:hypothetical protein
MRLLLAYAREFAVPRPYRLADLAQAAGAEKDPAVLVTAACLDRWLDNLATPDSRNSFS